MKRAGALLAMIVLLACLTGCLEQVTPQEKNEARQKGQQMMRQWLDQALPGAELLSAEPYVFHNLGVAPYTLTDMVSGTFRYRKENQKYWLDTASSQVYFEESAGAMAELDQLCERTVAQALQLGKSYEVSGDGVTVDLGVQDSNYRAPTVLPAEFVLSGESFESFLNSPEKRPVLTVSLSFLVPDETDLSSITLETAQRLLQEKGLLLDHFAVNSPSQRVVLYKDQASYERLAFGDLPDFRVWMPVLQRSEKLNKKTGAIDTETTTWDASRDLSVERTADGWKAAFPNGWFSAEVYAYDGSALLQETLIRKDNAAPDGKGLPLHWEKNDRGWALCDESGNGCCLLQDYDLALQ